MEQVELPLSLGKGIVGGVGQGGGQQAEYLVGDFGLRVLHRGAVEVAVGDVEALKGRIRVPQGHGEILPVEVFVFGEALAGVQVQTLHIGGADHAALLLQEHKPEAVVLQQDVPPVVAGIGPEPGEDGIGLTLGQIVAAGGGLVDGVLDIVALGQTPGRGIAAQEAEGQTQQHQQERQQLPGQSAEAIFHGTASYSPRPVGANLYPWPQTTLIYRGSEGLISIFSRRWRMWTATALSDPAPVSFQTDS